MMKTFKRFLWIPALTLSLASAMADVTPDGVTSGELLITPRMIPSGPNAGRLQVAVRDLPDGTSVLHIDPNHCTGDSCTEMGTKVMRGRFVLEESGSDGTTRSTFEMTHPGCGQPIGWINKIQRIEGESDQLVVTWGSKPYAAELVPVSAADVQPHWIVGIENQMVRCSR